MAQSFQLVKAATADVDRETGVRGYESVTFDIGGTATSADVKFFIIAGSGVRRAVQPIRMTNERSVVETANVGDIYNFGVSGVEKIAVVITGITGGYVDIWMTGDN